MYFPLENVLCRHSKSVAANDPHLSPVSSPEKYVLLRASSKYLTKLYFTVFKNQQQLPCPLSFLSPDAIICMCILNLVTRYIYRKTKSWSGSSDRTHWMYSWQLRVSNWPQRTYELFVPDTLHNMLLGFKKTLFHVLTLISLVCQPGELRGSLLYAAVICSISWLSLPAISVWYLVKVIFSWKSSALSVSASIALHQWPKNSELSGMYQDSW